MASGAALHGAASVPRERGWYRRWGGAHIYRDGPESVLADEVLHYRQRGMKLGGEILLTREDLSVFR